MPHVTLAAIDIAQGALLPLGEGERDFRDDVIMLTVLSKFNLSSETTWL
jgi:hypothetical protein